MIVSELVVVIAVCGSSLVLTGLHARRLSGFAVTPHDLERLLAAVQRAGADFLWQETRLLGVLAGIVLLVVAGPIAAAAPSAEGWPAAIGWSLAALGVGVAAGIAVAFLAHGCAARTAHGALGALRHDRNAATRVTLRGASLLAVGIDAVSTVLAASCFAAHYLFSTLVTGAEPAAAAALAARTLVPLAFGALCAAVVFQVGGASLHTAAGVAATSARARDPRIVGDEEQNPLLVAELVGDRVGGIVSRSTEALAGSLLANAGLVMLAALVAQANAESEAGAFALVALPLVVRTIGQFAATVALGSSRFEPRRSLSGTFLAARLSHAALLAAGVLGATRWLLGASLFAPYAAAGGLGVLAGTLAAGVSFMGSRRERPMNEARERSGPTLARALGLGLQRTWLLVVVVGGCVVAAWMLAARSPLVQGRAFGLVLAAAALLGAGAFNSCQSIFAVSCENVRKLAMLRRSRLDDPAKQRATEMDRAGVAVGHVGRIELILSAAAAALLAAVILTLLSASHGAASVGASWAHPLVLIGGVLGAGSLSLHIGGMLEASSRTATSLDKEASARLEREREGGPDARGPLPGYRDSVQLAAASATRALFPFALGAVLAPFAAALALRLFHTAFGGANAQGLLAFSALGALTGCAAALVAQGASLELARARRVAAESSSSSLSVTEFLERCIGPAALLGLKATVVSSLAVSSLAVSF